MRRKLRTSARKRDLNRGHSTATFTEFFYYIFTDPNLSSLINKFINSRANVHRLAIIEWKQRVSVKIGGNLFVAYARHSRTENSKNASKRSFIRWLTVVRLNCSRMYSCATREWTELKIMAFRSTREWRVCAWLREEYKMAVAFVFTLRWNAC